MKRKMGIRGLLSRSARNDPRDLDVSEPISEDRPSTEPDYTSNKFIGRPPPLPSNVERELRDACEFILRDLKPSGHDIEDRRMKSDMFVEQDPYAFNHKVKAVPKQEDDSRRNNQHSSAAWVMNGGNERERATQSERGPKAAGNMSKPTIDTAKANQKNIVAQQPPPSQPPLGPLSPLSSNKVIPAESPLAPLPTNVTGTRQPSMSASSKMVSSPGPQARRADSTSTEASNPFTPSTDYFKSASTAATSNASSNRASDNVYTQRASAKDGEWMKQEVERHKQAQAAIPSIATTAGAAAVLANDKSPQSEAGQQEPVAAQQQQQRDSLGNPNTTFYHHPRPQTGTRTSSRYSGASFDSEKSGGMAVGSARPASTGSRRHSRPSSRLSIDGIHETKTSPQPTPRNEDIPPVPRLDAERLNSLTSGSRSNSINQAAISEIAQQQRMTQGEQHLQKAPAVTNFQTNGFPPNQRPMSMTSRPAAPMAPPADAAQTTSPISDPRYQMPGQVPQGHYAVQQPPQATRAPPPLLQNGQIAQANYQYPQYQQPQPQQQPQQQGPNGMPPPQTVARDFYRPKAPLSPADFAYRRNDPTPADFEALMSAMDGAVHGQQPPMQSPPMQPPPLSIEPPQTQHMTVPNSIPARRSSLQGQRPPQHVQISHPQPQPQPQPPQGPQAHVTISHPPYANRTTDGMANGNSNGPRSPTSPPNASNTTSNRSSVMSPQRLSEAHSTRSAASKKEKKGLSRMLWRLGGGDVPERRKVYVPPYAPYERNGSMGSYWEEDEEQACAAPVVGFGRGW